MYRRFCSSMVPKINIPTLLQNPSLVINSLPQTPSELWTCLSLSLSSFFYCTVLSLKQVSLVWVLVWFFSFNLSLSCLSLKFSYFLFLDDEWKEQVSFHSMSMARAWTSSSHLQVHGLRNSHPTWSSFRHQKKLLGPCSTAFKALPSPFSTW